MGSSTVTVTVSITINTGVSLWNDGTWVSVSRWSNEGGTWRVNDSGNLWGSVDGSGSVVSCTGVTVGSTGNNSGVDWSWGGYNSVTGSWSRDDSVTGSWSRDNSVTSGRARDYSMSTTKTVDGSSVSGDDTLN